MTRTIIAAIAIAALACAAPASAASTKHHGHHTDAHAEATPVTKASEIPGVNPMQNSPAVPPTANKQPYVAVPGVNPM